VCEQCDTAVAPLRNGGYRNHCPACLYSKHLDVLPGDRAATCRGLMEPVALEHSSRKGMIVVHRCRLCGIIRRNRLANDPVQPDAIEAVIRLVHQANGTLP
jgi:hypothetical protein